MSDAAAAVAETKPEVSAAVEEAASADVPKAEETTVRPQCSVLPLAYLYEGGSQGRSYC